MAPKRKWYGYKQVVWVPPHNFSGMGPYKQVVWVSWYGPLHATFLVWAPTRNFFFLVWAPTRNFPGMGPYTQLSWYGPLHAFFFLLVWAPTRNFPGMGPYTQLSRYGPLHATFLVWAPTRTSCTGSPHVGNPYRTCRVSFSGTPYTDFLMVRRPLQSFVVGPLLVAATGVFQNLLNESFQRLSSRIT